MALPAAVSVSSDGLKTIQIGSDMYFTADMRCALIINFDIAVLVLVLLTIERTMLCEQRQNDCVFAYAKYFVLLISSWFM